MKSRSIRGRGNPNWVVVHLKKKDRERLRVLMSRGQNSVRAFKRARVLELMDEGESAPKAAKAAGVSSETARSVAKRYIEDGLDRALYDAKRPGTKRKVGSKEEARITAMVCSRPPEGYSRWTLRLIVREVENRGIVDSISIEHIRRLLKRNDLKPWREKNVVRA